MRYEDVAHRLAGIVDGSETVDDETAAFIATDLRCQAELVRYRNLLRDLRALRSRHLAPVPGSLDATFAALDEASSYRLRRAIGAHRGLAGAIGTAVVTAGAATAAVIIARSRGRRTAVAA